MANPPPRGQSIGQQAAVYANAAVPTTGSITSQYNQSLGDVHGFTNALVQLLQKGGQTDPYQGAVNSQTAANQAAVQRLTNLGSPYAAGSAAAVGGMGDSALGSLNAQRGAAIQYQRQLPGIASARGELANSSLLSQEHTALQQRSQQYQSAYMQALQQLRDYGLQKAGLNETIHQNNFNNNLALRQLQIQNKEFAANQAYQWAGLTQRANEFKSTQGQQWREFLIQAAAAAGDKTTAPSGPLGGFTRLQIHNMLADAGTGALHAIKLGEPPGVYISGATGAANLPAPLVLLAVKRVYGRLPKNSQGYKQYLEWINAKYGNKTPGGPLGGHH